MDGAQWPASLTLRKEAHSVFFANLDQLSEACLLTRLAAIYEQTIRRDNFALCVDHGSEHAR